MPVALQIDALLSCGQIRSLGGINADHDHAEVLAGHKAHHLQRARQPVQLLRAKHGALVINQRQNRRLLAEVTRQLHLLACIVGEGERERQLLIEPLRNPHLAQNIRRLVAHRRHLLLVVARYLRRQRRHEDSRAQRDNRRASPASPNCTCALHTVFFLCSPNKSSVPHPFRVLEEKMRKGGKPQISSPHPFSTLYLCIRTSASQCAACSSS
jgi:hypothetical protein